MRFATGFISPDHFYYPLATLHGQNWKIRFGKQINGTSTTAYIGRRSIPAKEVLIEARREEIARKAVSSIISAMVVVRGAAGLVNELPCTYESGAKPKSRVIQLHRGHWSAEMLPLACMIAAKASRRRNRQYALAKFGLSCETASFEWVDLDPSRSGAIPRWKRPEDHVRLAAAIVLAYSVIEELGLEVRASSDRPSTINSQWNPVVKGDLQSRLESAGVGANGTVLWRVRGGRTRLEAKRPGHLFESVRPAPWTGWGVRDQYVEVIDAIAYASFLRSKVSAHRLQPDLVRQLSAYDVANVQCLARRLFLEALGYWPLARAQKA